MKKKNISLLVVRNFYLFSSVDGECSIFTTGEGDGERALAPDTEGMFANLSDVPEVPGILASFSSSSLTLSSWAIMWLIN